MLAPCTYLPNISLRSFCEVRSVLPFSSFCTIFALFVWGRQPHPPILQISDEHRYFLNHSKHRYISLMNTWWWPMIEIFCVAQSSKISKIADFSLFLSIFVLCFYQVGTSSLWLSLIMTAKKTCMWLIIGPSKLWKKISHQDNLVKAESSSLWNLLLSLPCCVRDKSNEKK